MRFLNESMELRVLNFFVILFPEKKVRNFQRRATRFPFFDELVGTQVVLMVRVLEREGGGGGWFVLQRYLVIIVYEEESLPKERGCLDFFYFYVYLLQLILLLLLPLLSLSIYPHS